MSEPDPVPRKISAVWAPLLLLALSLGYVWWAQDYSSGPSLMPTLVGATTAVLALLDLVSRLDNPVGNALRVTLGADFKSPEMAHDPALPREVAIISAMLGCVVSMLLIGILPTVPLFIALYVRGWGGLPWVSALIAAGVVLAFVVGVFELALSYDLYRGLLFGARGL